jgi:hypothetical protein
MTYDDGKVPLAFLHEKFAVKIHSPQLHLDCGEIRATVPEVEVHASSAPQDRPPSIASESEEDPFGHMQAGFDDVPAIGCGKAGTAAGSPCAPTAADPGVQEESGAEDTTELQHTAGEAGPIHVSHSLRSTAGAVWCSHCGRSAIARIGIGLLRPCRGVADGAYPARMERLRAGLHPVSGRPLRAQDIMTVFD